MEIKRSLVRNKKLNAPSGNVQDIRYLYNIIAGLRIKGGRSENNNKTLEFFKKIINEYNNAKADRYGISFRPKKVNITVIKHVITELQYLNLIHKNKEYLLLTEEGENIANLIEKKDSIELKKIFSKLMLEKFSVFEFFLKRIKELSNGNGVPIPIITSEVFDKSKGDPRKIGEIYNNIISNYCSNICLSPEKLFNLLYEANLDSIEKRTEKIKKIQSIIEKFIVLEAFAPNIQSRRVYDFVRSRTTFLELTNYATFDFEGFPAEVTYLISDFNKTFNNNALIIEYSGGKIFINYPTFEEIKDYLKENILKIYDLFKNDFGYIKIADLRDRVCLELKISDNLFDRYLKKLYNENPHWLSFTYAGAEDKITEKRLPIVFETPIREIFTLLKINLER